MTIFGEVIIHFCHNCCMWNHDKEECKALTGVHSFCIYIAVYKCIILLWNQVQYFFMLYILNYTPFYYMQTSYTLICLSTPTTKFVVLVCSYHKLTHGRYDSHSIYICWCDDQLIFKLVIWIIILVVMVHTHSRVQSL